MKRQYKVLFANICNYQFPEKEVVPLGQLLLATILSSKEMCEAKVLDMNYVYSKGLLKKCEDLEEMLEETAEYLLQENPNFISFYSMCNIHHYVIKIASIIKRKSPKTIICLAGPHATVTARDNLEKFEFIDCIALGEGELTVESIIFGAMDQNFANSRGIAYRYNKDIVIIENDDLLCNLDTLPIIDFSLLNFIPSKTIYIEVGRGCPFSCTFCTTNSFWHKKYRLKSPERIIEEIKYIIEQFNIYDFSFEHDLFLLNKEIVMKVCELIIKNKLKITWGCSSRIDCIDEELIYMLSKAGCRGIFFGIESASRKIQSIIKKNLDISQLEILIPWLQGAGISPTFSFICGFPEETDDDIEETLELMYKIYEIYHKNYLQNKTKVQLHRLVFMPETPITKEQYDNLRLPQYYRTDLQYGEECWENRDVIELLNNKKIFTQYFELKSDFARLIEDIDVFYGFLFNYFIEYLDMTYKSLLYHYKRHLYLFRAFKNTIGSEKINRVFQNEKFTNGDIITWSIELMHSFIDVNDFGEDATFIRNMFYFEYNIFVKKHSKVENKFTMKVDYDVVRMKKQRELDFARKGYVIEFEENSIHQRCDKL
ncbi:MAG: radical SAM protein [Lachnospiraceae bacterium]